MAKFVNPIHGVDGQLMVTAAHRYCLGRQSYIVGSAIDWIRKWKGDLERNTIRVIVRDTIEAIQDGHAGQRNNRRSALEGSRARVVRWDV